MRIFCAFKNYAIFIKILNFEVHFLLLLQNEKILLCFLASIPCIIYAQTNVTLTTKGNGSGGEGLHNEMPLPQVTYDDNTVCIADSLSRVAEIVIKDTD